jgi:hypothetical protein
MRLLLYVQYLLNIVFQVWIACMCVSQVRWNKWRRYGKLIFFGAGAITSLTLAGEVFTKEELIVPLTGGTVFWSGLVRMVALGAIAYGLWRARHHFEEDVV